MKVTNLKSYEIYSKAEMDDGTKLYFGFGRWAFPIVVIRPDGSKYRLSMNEITGEDPIMVTEEQYKSFGSNWGYCGIHKGKLAIVQNGTPPNPNYPTIKINGLIANLYNPAEPELAAEIGRAWAEWFGKGGDWNQLDEKTQSDEIDILIAEIKAVGAPR